MNRVINISIIALLALASCKKHKANLAEDDYMIFGHYFGECLGEQCVETYKLTEDKLFEDSQDNYGGGPFSFVELDSDIFSDVYDLVDEFPEELDDVTDATFGCPDCHDQGGVYIQYNRDGETKEWRIDRNKEAIPAYLHGFIDSISEAIDKINN